MHHKKCVHPVVPREGRANPHSTLSLPYIRRHGTPCSLPCATDRGNREDREDRVFGERAGTSSACSPICVNDRDVKAGVPSGRSPSCLGGRIKVNLYEECVDA